jgi:hypothetical protein
LNVVLLSRCDPGPILKTGGPVQDKAGPVEWARSFRIFKKYPLRFRERTLSLSSSGKSSMELFHELCCCTIIYRPQRRENSARASLQECLNEANPIVSRWNVGVCTGAEGGLTCTEDD